MRTAPGADSAYTEKGPGGATDPGAFLKDSINGKHWILNRNIIT